MINFEERRRYGVYFRVERTDDPDYTYQGLPEELPTSFLCVGVDSSLAEEVERWCDANLYGKWKRNVFGGETMPVYGRWTFWNKRDALTFKMVWGNYRREWEDPFAIKRR